MAQVDVVVVSFNSARHLRACVSPLVQTPGVTVTVVDNASTDGTLKGVADLPLRVVALPSNGGFAVGCNEGWRVGRAPFVLFLNPDATIDEASLRTLVEVLERDACTGAVAPRLTYPDGSPAFSLRRYPRLRSTFATAFFLHRLFPSASWTDEVIRDGELYERPWSPEWVSGACVLVRRSALEALDGWDERFFLYCEDVDLCLRLRGLGLDVRYEPSARAIHHEGASAPHGATLPLLASARILYARKHRGRVAAALDRVGVAAGALTHLIAGRGGRQMRLGQLRALRVAVLGPLALPRPRR